MDKHKLEEVYRQISDSAIREYIEKGDDLLRGINHWISSPRQQDRFLNGNSIKLLLDNHKNHLGFISQVLKTKDTKALIQALPWVYRAYHSQGIPFDYFLEELQKWRELLFANLHQQHAEEVSGLYDWMTSVHCELIEISENMESEDTISLEHPFMKAITGGDHRAAYRYAQDSVKSWDDFEHFFLTVVQPSLYEIGLLWEKGTISVAVEHIATAIANRVLSGLLFTVEVPAPIKSNVMVTCATSEFHQIGPWMVSVALEADGWDVDYLGVDTPPDEMIDIIKEKEHKAVLISVTMPFNITPAQELVSLIKKSCPEVKVIVGGQAFSFLNHPEETTDADATIDTYTEAIELLNQWLVDKE